MIRIVPLSSGLTYLRGNNVFGDLPFLWAPIPLGFIPSLEVGMPMVVYIFPRMSMFLGAIPLFGEPIPQELYRNKGETIFMGDHHTREDMHPLLIHIWGDHMVLLV